MVYTYGVCIYEAAKGPRRMEERSDDLKLPTLIGAALRTKENPPSVVLDGSVVRGLGRSLGSLQPVP